MIRFLLSITAWFILGATAAQVRADWQRAELEQRLAVARMDADEAETIAQQLLSGGRFVMRNVSPGVYQWRFAPGKRK